jgi:hypothetical protein
VCVVVLGCRVWNQVGCGREVFRVEFGGRAGAGEVFCVQDRTFGLPLEPRGQVGRAAVRACLYGSGESESMVR